MTRLYCTSLWWPAKFQAGAFERERSLLTLVGTEHSTVTQPLRLERTDEHATVDRGATGTGPPVANWQCFLSAFVLAQPSAWVVIGFG